MPGYVQSFKILGEYLTLLQCLDMYNHLKYLVGVGEYLNLLQCLDMYNHLKYLVRGRISDSTAVPGCVQSLKYLVGGGISDSTAVPRYVQSFKISRGGGGEYLTLLQCLDMYNHLKYLVGVGEYLYCSA